MKVFKSAEMWGYELFLETANEEVQVSERKKKLGTEGCIWSESFPAMAGKEGEWIQDGKFLRAGVSALVLNGNKVILNRFDSGHPTAAGKLSTPAGVWEGNEDLFDTALKELAEEVIITDTKCGFWSWNNSSPLQPGWVKEYAKDHGMDTIDFRVDVTQFDYQDSIGIYLNDQYQGEAILAYEPENGGIEIIFILQTEIDISNLILKDGERFGTQWLDREVGLFSKEDLLKETRKTTKVEAVEQLLRNL